MDALADEALGPDPEPVVDPLDDDLPAGPEQDRGSAQTSRELSRRSRLLMQAPKVRDALSARRKKTFLRALSQLGNVTAASAAAGWGMGIAYSVRKADKEFAQGWEWALEVFGATLEMEAHRRAVHGVTKGVYGSLGKDEGSGLIGTEVVYSDKLLETLLKANMRSKYGDKAEIDVTSKGGVLHVPAAPTDWERLAGAGQQKFRENTSDED